MEVGNFVLLVCPRGIMFCLIESLVALSFPLDTYHFIRQRQGSWSLDQQRRTKTEFRLDLQLRITEDDFVVENSRWVQGKMTVD